MMTTKEQEVQHNTSVSQNRDKQSRIKQKVCLLLTTVLLRQQYSQWENRIVIAVHSCKIVKLPYPSCSCTSGAFLSIFCIWSTSYPPSPALSSISYLSTTAVLWICVACKNTEYLMCLSDSALFISNTQTLTFLLWRIDFLESLPFNNLSQQFCFRTSNMTLKWLKYSTLFICSHASLRGEKHTIRLPSKNTLS